MKSNSYKDFLKSHVRNVNFYEIILAFNYVWINDKVLSTNFMVYDSMLLPHPSAHVLIGISKGHRNCKF